MRANAGRPGSAWRGARRPVPARALLSIATPEHVRSQNPHRMTGFVWKLSVIAFEELLRELMIVAKCLCGKGAKSYKFCGENAFDGEKDPSWGQCRSPEEGNAGWESLRAEFWAPDQVTPPRIPDFRGDHTLPELPA